MLIKRKEFIQAGSLATASFLLQVKEGVDQSILNKYSDASGRESFIKTVTIQIMSTPEYQLC